MPFSPEDFPDLQLKFANPTARVYTCEQNQLVYAKWCTNQMNADWDAAVNAILNAFETHPHSGYISDASIGLPLSRRMMIAIVKDILPRFRKTKMRYISVIVPENLSIEMTIQAILNLVPPPYRCRTSENLSESYAWVKEQQRLALQRTA